MAHRLGGIDKNEDIRIFGSYSLDDFLYRHDKSHHIRNTGERQDLCRSIDILQNILLGEFDVFIWFD